MRTATSDLSGQSYHRLASFNSSLTVLYPIYRTLAIRGRIKFRLLLWQDDVWGDKSMSRYSCLATYNRPHNSSITYRCPLSNTLTLGGWLPGFRLYHTSSFTMTSLHNSISFVSTGHWYAADAIAWLAFKMHWSYMWCDHSYCMLSCVCEGVHFLSLAAQKLEHDPD